jgi:serine/threonine protein kinase
MNVKIIKKLGSGMVGTVYLSIIDGKQAVTKIEKYDGDLTTKSTFIRQIIFDENVAKFYPERFMTLVSTGIIYDCKFKQEFPKNFKKSSQQSCLSRDLDSKILKEKSGAYNKCFILSYRPVLKYTFKKIYIKLTPSEKLKIFKHLETSLSIMHKKGFCHRDIHMENIMCDSTRNHWYLIDYGLVSSDSFIKNLNDRQNFEYYCFLDILSLIQIFMENPVFDEILKQQEKKQEKQENTRSSENNTKKNITEYEKALKLFKKDSRYKNIKSFLPKKTFNKQIKNLIIEILCCLTHYDLYISTFHRKYINLKVAKDNINLIQPNRDYFLRLIKNY